MQNKRDRTNGTGKLRSYWEHSIFEVVEKKDNVPVYTIRNIDKKSDRRVVHRNLLMLCNELPVETFGKGEAGKMKGDQKKKGKQTGEKQTKKKKLPVISDSSSSSDSEPEGYVEIVEYPEVEERVPVLVDEDDENEEEAAAPITANEETVINVEEELVEEESAEEMIPEEVEPVREEEEESVIVALDEEPVQILNGGDVQGAIESSSEETSADDEEDLGSEDGSPQIPIRRSSRTSKPAKRMDMKVLGGMPELVEVQRSKR